MNVKEVEVVHKEKVYELTGSELKELKDKYFNEGIDSVLDYIGESYNNYILEKNIGGVLEFVNEVIKFCINKHGIKPCNMCNVGCMKPYMDYTPRTLEYILEACK